LSHPPHRNTLPHHRAHPYLSLGPWLGQLVAFVVTVAAWLASTIGLRIYWAASFTIFIIVAAAAAWPISAIAATAWPFAVVATWPIAAVAETCS
jgi:hypothetical protein